MKHLKTVSRTPALAQFGGIGGIGGSVSIAEQVVLIVLGMLFGDWQNYSQVIQNLQKYYRKTPD